MIEAEFIEEIHDADTLLSRPGRYYTTTGQQAYAVVKAMKLHPLVELGQELFFPEGSTLPFTVKHEGEIEQNPKLVGWGTASDYFVRRLESYDRWESAWWREVIQNARDARASRIDLTIEEGVYEDPDSGDRVASMRVSCTDNGTGMDAATLEKAFFTRGGSVKEAGAVGGFGDAKELILSPWLGYEVRTRDLVARGRHESLFEPGIQGGQRLITGTQVVVWMPLQRTTSAEYASQLVERCNLPGIVVTLNGKRVAADLIGGNRVLTAAVREKNSGDSIGTLQINHQPRARRQGVYIRGNGVYMFELEGFSGQFKGVVYVDIIAPARKVFTRKRDALSYESNAREQIFTWMKELAVDPMTQLKKERAEKHKMRRIFRGEGALDVQRGIAAEIASKLAIAIPEKEMTVLIDEARSDEPLEINKSTIGMLAEKLAQAIAEHDANYSPSNDAPSVDLRPLIEAFTATMEGVEFFKTEQIAGAMMLAAWKPDLYVYQNLDNWRMPKKLDPANMQVKYVRLLRLWAELCKYALIQLGLFEPFGVGWCFDTEMDEHGEEMVMAAACATEQGMKWLLINPIKLKRKRGSDPTEYEDEGDLYDLSRDRDLEELCASVIHEVTHMQGFGRHDQAYAYALTRNIRIAFGMKQAAKKIMKAVNTAVREETVQRKAAIEASKLVVRFAEKHSGDAKYQEKGMDVLSAKAINVSTGTQVGEIELVHDWQPIYVYRWHDDTGYERAKTVNGYDTAKSGLLKTLKASEEGAAPVKRGSRPKEQSRGPKLSWTKMGVDINGTIQVPSDGVAKLYGVEHTYSTRFSITPVKRSSGNVFDLWDFRDGHATRLDDQPTLADAKRVAQEIVDGESDRIEPEVLRTFQTGPIGWEDRGGDWWMGTVTNYGERWEVRPGTNGLTLIDRNDDSKTDDLVSAQDAKDLAERLMADETSRKDRTWYARIPRGPHDPQFDRYWALLVIAMEDPDRGMDTKTVRDRNWAEVAKRMVARVFASGLDNFDELVRRTLPFPWPYPKLPVTMTAEDLHMAGGSILWSMKNEVGVAEMGRAKWEPSMRFLTDAVVAAWDLPSTPAGPPGDPELVKPASKMMMSPDTAKEWVTIVK